jgi:hypothetical protein
MLIMFKCGNYSQKHVRDAALCENKKAPPFWGLTSSKTFTKVPLPFCNESSLRSKLTRAVQWHQDLLRAMLDTSRSDPALAPLVRCHLRGVRYGIARQVQQYLERLGALCAKDYGSMADAHCVSVDGLFKWLQMYCRLWMVGFQVGALFVRLALCQQRSEALSNALQTTGLPYY